MLDRLSRVFFKSQKRHNNCHRAFGGLLKALFAIFEQNGLSGG
jgi:hypothetical protein